MNSFTTRVELHGAYGDDYTRLHGQMALQGFTRTITADNGSVYQLPTAEYRYAGYVTKFDVLEKAQLAAAAVKPSFEVLVTDGGNWCSSGLTQLRRAA